MRPTPALLDTMVRSFAPCSISPSMSALGWPILPKPPSNTTAPSPMSAMAWVMLCTILLIIDCAFPGRSAACDFTPPRARAALPRKRASLRGQNRASCPAPGRRRPAAVGQEVADAEPLQLFQFTRDFIRRAVERALFARLAGVGERHDAGLALGPVRSVRGGGEPALRFEPALQRCLLVGLVL